MKKYLERPRELADLVLSVRCGNMHVLFAFGQAAGNVGHLAKGARNVARENAMTDPGHHGSNDCGQEEADQQPGYHGASFCVGNIADTFDLFARHNGQIDDLLAIGVNCISEGMSASVREAQALRPSDLNPQSFKHRALLPQFRQNRGSVTDGSIFEEFDIAISAVERSQGRGQIDPVTGNGVALDEEPSFIGVGHEPLSRNGRRRQRHAFDASTDCEVRADQHHQEGSQNDSGVDE